MDYSRECYLSLLRIEALLTAFIGNTKGVITDEEFKACVNSEIAFEAGLVELYRQSNRV